MALASDLMALSVPPLLAAHTATGGTGPVTIVSGGSAGSGTTYATSTELGVTQYFVTATGTNATTIGLPSIGGDTGCLLGDCFVINSAGTSTLQVIASTSVLISCNGSLSSKQTLRLHSTMVLYPVQSTLATGTANWIGVSGN